MTTLTKPFGLRELHARVQVALRHHRPEGGKEYPAQLDVGAYRLAWPSGSAARG